MHVNVTRQCWHLNTVYQVCSCVFQHWRWCCRCHVYVFHYIRSLCVYVCIQYHHTVSHRYSYTIYYTYNYLPGFKYILNDYNHLCIHRYAYKHTNTRTHYIYESTSNSIDNNNREEKREKYKYKCWKYRTHKRTHIDWAGWLAHFEHVYNNKEAHKRKKMELMFHTTINRFKLFVFHLQSCLVFR